MPGEHRYQVELEQLAREGLYEQVAFSLPGDAVPGDAITWVSGTINGHQFECTSSPQEDGRRLVFVPADLREAIGVKAGDRVEVTLDPPDERPEVGAPDDFREALARGAAGLDFEQLNARQRREYVEWVEAGEGDERGRRIERAVAAIRDRKPPREAMSD